ncbi:MAG: hypothetical protein LJE61_03130 [Thiocapsa sp.]|jgi:hypothetical protein|nr:hypothetical protein [Thiocapsa sp.]MCG6898065.1 hypothetical protein [Thiocapsa sp.]MCG6984184.1 hypothetical protein [Thiocapsa sp.]
MADLFSVTAPPTLRCPDGTRQIIAACLPRARRLLDLDLHWHQCTPAPSAHLLAGALRSAGPWRIGGCVISVPGCHHTGPDPAAPFAAWLAYLVSDGGASYPPSEQIRAVARRLGALV